MVCEKVLAEDGNHGYNAATDVYEDLVAAGIIDPAKVTRTALQNAASVSTLLLTSEALIAEKPAKGKGGRHGRRRPLLSPASVLGTEIAGSSKPPADTPGASFVHAAGSSSSTSHCRCPTGIVRRSTCTRRFSSAEKR